MRPIKSQWSVSRAYGPAWSPCGAMRQCTQNCGLLWSGTFSHTHFTTKGHDIPWLPKTNAPLQSEWRVCLDLQAIFRWRGMDLNHQPRAYEDFTVRVAVPYSRISSLRVRAMFLRHPVTPWPLLVCHFALTRSDHRLGPGRTGLELRP